MSLCRTVGLAGLVSKRSFQYGFVASTRLRSSKGETGVFEDKEKATENIFVRKHEEEEMQKRKFEQERKAKEEAAKKKAEKK